MAKPDPAFPDQEPSRFCFWGPTGFHIGLVAHPEVPALVQVKLLLDGPPDAPAKDDGRALIPVEDVLQMLEAQQAEPGEDRGMRWGGPWPEPGLPLDPVRALSGLAASWRALAKGFAGPDGREDGSIPDGEHDLGDILGLPPDPARPRLLWVTTGPFVTLRSGEVTANYRTDTICLIESLAGFAERLATILGGIDLPGAADAVAAWRYAFAATDIMPWEAEAIGRDDELTADEELGRLRAAAAFYCRRLGADLDRFIRLSTWLLAEQGRFALGRRPEGEPDWREHGFDAPGWGGLPTMEELETATPNEVRVLYTQADQGAPDAADWRRFVAAALAQRTFDLRDALYFAHHREVRRSLL